MAAPVVPAAVLAARRTRRQVLMLAGGLGGGAIIGAIAGISGLVAAVSGDSDGPRPGPPSGEDATPGANGWAWPSSVRGVTQGFHDGFSIDLATPDGGPLYAPFSGVVIQAGGDGGGIPGVCVVNPAWWHGQNSTVLIQHEFQGHTMYSSHNHVDPASIVASGITVGSAVRSGQIVANAGMSGCTSGPHTHFTLASTPRNYSPDINPYTFIGSP